MFYYFTPDTCPPEYHLITLHTVIDTHSFELSFNGDASLGSHDPLLLLLLILLLLLCMLLISRSRDLMEDTYVRLINCRLYLFLSSASSVSSQYLLPFLKSSRSCVLPLLLPTPFISIICLSMAS